MGRRREFSPTGSKHRGIRAFVDVPGKENEWPGMGLIIQQDRILYELQRKYLPNEFRDFRYRDSRRLFDAD